MKCCLVIGHTPKAPGAVNARAKVSEWDFNRPLATLVAAGACEVVLLERGLPNDHAGLPAKINALECDFVIEMHANASAAATASGSEVLYWQGSAKGKRLAEILLQEFRLALDLRDRGIKPITSGRGALLLKGTRAPCVIAEPFFIDHDSDLEEALAWHEELTGAYVRAIKEYAKPPAPAR